MLEADEQDTLELQPPRAGKKLQVGSRCSWNLLEFNLAPRVFFLSIAFCLLLTNVESPGSVKCPQGQMRSLGLLCFSVCVVLPPHSSAEAHACSHLLRPHAFRLGPGQRGRAERGSVEGAGARASAAAPERLPEERPGASPQQEAARRVAIAMEEVGSSTLPSRTETALLQLLRPSVPHASCFSKALGTRKNLSALKMRVRERAHACCWHENLTALAPLCSHTEP